MMKRLALITALALAPGYALAQSVQDQIIQQLTDQGFDRIEVRRTMLGRVRILAWSDRLRREIVFVPDTGAILRDYWIELDDDDDAESGPNIVDPGNGNGGGGPEGPGNDDDDGDDDEGDDDESDDDHEDEEDEEDEDEEDEDDEDDEDDDDEDDDDGS